VGRAVQLAGSSMRRASGLSCVLLPAPLIDGMTGMNLRVAAAQNGQRASLHWARDYELRGAV